VPQACVLRACHIKLTHEAERFRDRTRIMRASVTRLECL